MTLAQRIVEEEEVKRDAYELAGCTRFTPRLDEVQAGLKRLAAENAPYVAHWQKDLRAKGQQLQQQIEQAQQIFATAESRQRYDEQLLNRLRAAYARELSGQAGEPLRRWLRLAQNIHAARIEEIARKLTDPKAPTASAVQPTPVAKAAPIAAPAPQPAAEPVKETKVRAAPRPPVRKQKPDDFGLMWIVGSAAATAVIALFVMLYVFRDRFGRAQPPAVVQNAEPQNLPAENPEPPPEELEQPPVLSVETSPPKKNITEEPKQPIEPPTPAPQSMPATPTPQPQPMPMPATQPEETASTTPMPAAPPMPPSVSPQPAGSGTRQQIHFGRAIHSLAWDNSGKQLALVGEGSDVLLWDATKGVEARRLTETFNSAMSVGFGSGGRNVAVATSDSTVFVWNATSGKLERTLRHADLNDPRVLHWMPGTGDPQLLIGDGSGALRTFSVGSNNPTSALELATEAGAVQAIACSSKRPVAVSAHLDGTVAVWNITGKSLLKCLITPEAAICKTLAGNAAANSKSAELTHWVHEACLDVALSPDELLLAVAATDLEIWEFDAARHMVRKRQLPGAEGARAYRVVDFSSDGSLLAAGNAEGLLVIVDIASWTVVLQEKLPSAVLCLAWHPTDPRLLAVGQENGQGTIMPLVKNINTFKATPDFESQKLVDKLKEVVEEESWHGAARLLNVLSAYQLPLAVRTEVDRHRAATRKAVQKIIDEIDPKDVPDEDVLEAADNLQLAIDVDSTGKLGKDARAKLRQLPVCTPAVLAKAAAAEAATNKNKPVNNQAAPAVPPFPFAPGFNPNAMPRKRK